MTKTDVSVEIYYSGAWHDVTAINEVYTRDGISINRGRPDRASVPPPSQAELTIRNQNAKYGPRVPGSALYRLIGTNTPLRISLGKSSVWTDTFTRSVVNGFGTSTSGHVYTLSGTAADFDVDGSRGTIQPSATAATRYATVDSGWLDCNILATFRVNTLPASGTYQFGLLGRFSSASNHYGGVIQVDTTGAATLVLRRRIAAVTTSTTQVSGITLSTATDYRVRFELYGEFAKVKIWLASGDEPTDPTSTAILAGRLTGLSTGTEVGIFAINNTAVTTHVFSVDNVEAAPQYRFHGEVPGWPVRWNVKGNDVWVPITAFGPRRRLNTPGTLVPVLSAMTRAVLADDDGLVELWPLEDGSNAVTGASGLPGGRRTQTLVAPATFGAEQIGYSGSPTGIDFSSGGSLIATTGKAVVAAPNGWEFEFVVAWRTLPTIPVGETRSIAHAISSGVSAVMGVGLINSGGTIKWADYMYDYSGSGVIDTLSLLDNPVAGRTYHVRVKGSQVGAGVRITVYIDGVGPHVNGFDETLMMPSRIALNTSYTPTTPTNTANPPFLSGLSFREPFRASPTSYLAGDGHVGETAADRILRVCAENNLAAAIYGDVADTEMLGQQLPATTTDILDQAAASDGGILFEARQFLGFVYRTHVSMYNMDASLTLDYDAGGQVAPGLDPEPDARDIANDVTVTNINSSFARLVQETGPLNIQEPGVDPDAVGRYQKDYPTSVADDARCLQQAGWLLHLGTWDEERYPVINVDLNAMAVEGDLGALIDQTIALDIGSRLAVEDVPAWLPGDISQITQGMAERLESHRHTISINTTPEGAWRVGVLDSTTNGKLDCRGSTLASGIDSDDTALSVTVIDSCLWSTTAEPYDIVINGERMTVTACTGASSPQAFTVTRSVNGAVLSHAAGSEVHIWQPFVLSSHPREG